MAAVLPGFLTTKDWRKVAVKFLEGFVRRSNTAASIACPTSRSLLYLADYPTTATVVVILGRARITACGLVPGLDQASKLKPSRGI